MTTEGAPHVGAEWRYLVLDLWTATGRESREFEAFCDEHGASLTWSLLLAEIRDAGRCWAPMDYDDRCVLAEGHVGPHYGADDVGSPVDLRSRRRRIACRPTEADDRAPQDRSVKPTEVALRLFDVGPVADPPASLSPDARRTARRHEAIANGKHPLRLDPLREPRDETCGSCRFLTAHGHNLRTYYKCELRPHEVTFGAATDVRLSWPACIRWEPDEQ